MERSRRAGSCRCADLALAAQPAGPSRRGSTSRIAIFVCEPSDYGPPDALRRSRASSASATKASITWRRCSSSSATRSVPALPTTSHTTFGGAPRRKLSCRKSSSFVTIVNPSLAARDQSVVSPAPRSPRSRTCTLPGKAFATLFARRWLRFSSNKSRGKARPQAAGGSARRRSRAAAKANTARMCSVRRSGKSARISASVMPPARYSSTSATVMRVPRMQGLPLRTPGVTVM